MKGSTTAFVAIYRSMLSKGMVAIARFTRTDKSPPRLVALVPQKEVVNSKGEQTEPPGVCVCVCGCVCVCVGVCVRAREEVVNSTGEQTKPPGD